MSEKEQRTCATGISVSSPSLWLNGKWAFLMHFWDSIYRISSPAGRITRHAPLRQISISTSSFRESITYLRHIPILLRLHGVTGGFASRQHWITNNLRRDGLTICISCCCCCQLQRANLQNIFCETEGGQEFTGARFNLALASFHSLECFSGAEDTCTSWPFQWRWWIFHRLQLLAFLNWCIIESSRGSWPSLFPNHQRYLGLLLSGLQTLQQPNRFLGSKLLLQIRTVVGNYFAWRATMGFRP